MSVYIDAQTCVSVDDGRRYSSNDDRTDDHYNHNQTCGLFKHFQHLKQWIQEPGLQWWSN